ncbi:nitrous oxide reductase family maturation protein NosD [Laribacter hongkongensis]|uniref:nitrous oxide reductase family maturation protein NosD n=1 Tax=Laribacter hongkongensis TaxID=168471 RepID=UPI001EFEED84|nr:nitrous oxide reductase family maturation protein NosD [Laribacter hongkongensis]MCG9054174.1 nitrous oxide reductase family maturation protein NosD [Laribacter hongkongensis]
MFPLPGWFALLLAGPAASAVAADWSITPAMNLDAAIAHAAPGDTLRLAPGIYPANLQINKPLTLTAADPAHRPTLTGSNQHDVIRVNAPDVTLDGLIIRDSGGDLGAQNAGVYLAPGAHRAVVRRCDFAYTLFGLWIEKANQARIENNLITGKRDFMSAQRGNGIQLYNTQGARIEGNHISYVRDGIYVDVSHYAVFRNNRIHHVRYGTHYMNSYHNLWENNDVYLNRGGLALMEVRDQVVRNNRAWGNTDHGIMLRTIQDSVIENNVVADNVRGFFIYDAEYNTLRHNLVSGNRVGVHLWAGSYRNKVEGNDFIDNREQIRYVASRDQSWGEQEGNYWSNYTGWDRDGDGRGDLPYEANDVVDRVTWRYPIVKLLLHSPAVQTLHMIARQFPVLRVPSVVEDHPAMQPHRPDWRRWVHAERH